MAYFALNKDRQSMSLHVAALDGSNTRQIVGGESFQGFYAPRFSPDGKRIVFSGFGGPETDEQGNPLATSSRSPLEGILGLFAPAVAEAHGQPWGIWIVNVDGTGLRRLTILYHGLPMASFSPDGTQIIAMDGSGIYLMQADGGQIQQIDTVGDNGGIVWTR
jgi:Tol biopolymer transport system component